VLANVLKAA
jgi:chromosome segregation ATPase